MEPGIDRPQDGRAWLTPVEAAELIGLSLEWFRELARKKGLTRYCPRGRRFFYLREEVESWAEFVTLRKQWRERHRPCSGQRHVEKIDPAVARTVFISSREAAA